MAADPHADGAAPRTATPAAQLEALAAPTRRAVYRLLLDIGEPMTVDSIAEAVGITANMARRHLDVLVDAALADEATEHRRDRGRPRRLYLGRHDALPGWGADGAFATLAVLLAEVHRDGADPYEVGFRHAATEAADSADVPIDRLWRSLLAAGYEPCAPPEGGGTVVLRACPVAAAAEVDPATVCRLHRGLIDGILGIGDPGVQLHPRPPREAGCEIRLPGEPAAPAALARPCG